MKKSIIAQRLKLAREHRKMTQVEVYNKTGINNKTLSGYENDVSDPDLDTLKILSKLYKCTTDYLLGNTDHPGIARIPQDKNKELPKRAIELGETMELSEERERALGTFKEMSPEEQTKRLLSMYEKLKSLPLEQQKALEVIIEQLSVRQ